MDEKVFFERLRDEDCGLCRESKDSKSGVALHVKNIHIKSKHWKAVHTSHVSFVAQYTVLEKKHIDLQTKHQ